MKKVLLVGKSADITDPIKNGLSKEFSIQRTLLKIENMRGTLKVIKPDITIICYTKDDEESREFFEWLDTAYPDILVILAASEECNARADMLCLDARYFKISYPVNINELNKLCDKFTAIENIAADKSANLRKQIMLVDDSAIVLRNMKSMLEKKYDIILATSGEMALEKVLENKIDLILLDYEMPKKDGKETFINIKQLDEGRDIPVIFLTNVSDRAKIFDILKIKPAGYILKPPDEEKLFEEIDNALGN